MKYLTHIACIILLHSGKRTTKRFKSCSSVFVTNVTLNKIVRKNVLRILWSFEPIYNLACYLAAQRAIINAFR